MQKSIAFVTLNNGVKMPLIGLGTWRLSGREATKAVQRALALGYTHIDTAHVYENHKAIGAGLKGHKRDQLFITSKLAALQVEKKDVAKSIEKACDKALKELGLNYLDLYLLHWPDRSLPMSEILFTMQGLVTKGKLRAIGVSNCTIHHLQDLLRDKVALQVNQVEFHPFLYQKELLEFCQKKKIQLESYRTLGKGALLDKPQIKKIGQEHQKSSAQIILRWAVQKEIPVIPKASSEAHLKENLAIFDFSLTSQEMRTLDALNQNLRFCDAEWADFSY